MNVHVRVLAAAVLILCGGLRLEGQAVAAAVDADLAIANGYDDAWETEWVAHLREIHKRAKNKTAGFVIHLGDSITHYKGYSQFALNCQATDELGQAVKWSKADGPDTDQAAPDCRNGWSLTYTQVKSDNPRWRSYTACKGITVH